MQNVHTLRLVHCLYNSSGTGRTGTFIALDYLLTEGTETGTVDVEGCIRALREQRAYAVQSSVNNRKN